MYGALGAPTLGSNVSHWMSLLGFTLVMLGVTWLAFRRIEQNS
jgi:ABC-2 type transport system permease protein